MHRHEPPRNDLYISKYQISKSFPIGTAGTVVLASVIYMVPGPILVHALDDWRRDVSRTNAVKVILARGLDAD
jgi:hypothetical protein